MDESFETCTFCSMTGELIRWLILGSIGSLGSEDTAGESFVIALSLVVDFMCHFVTLLYQPSANLFCPV